MTINKYPDKIARIHTGTYTGDGGTELAITGVGFRPKFVLITRRIPVGGNLNVCMKFGSTWGIYSFLMSVTAFISSVGIKSFDADGFTVSDSTSNLDPNTSGVTYDYLALG